MRTVGYYGMIENLDYNVGRILTALKALGIDRETYVVYFSDHGDMLASHGISGNSLPWEECIRIPFIVGMVGGHFSMKVGTSDAPVNHVDIAPTTLGLCGIEIPQRMVGYDYSRYCIRQDRPEYRGEPDPDGEPDSAFLQQIPRKFYCPVNRAWRGVVMHDGWKYVCTPHNDWLLYDTASRPLRAGEPGVLVRPPGSEGALPPSSGAMDRRNGRRLRDAGYQAGRRRRLLAFRVAALVLEPRAPGWSAFPTTRAPFARGAAAGSPWRAPIAA